MSKNAWVVVSLCGALGVVACASGETTEEESTTNTGAGSPTGGAGGISSAAGGNASGENASGGNASGGNAAGGNAAGGNAAGGNGTGGNASGGNAAGGNGTGGMGTGGNAGGMGGAGGSGGGMGGAGGAGDVTPPTVASTTPADTTTAVLSDSTIEVTFSEPMNAATITADTNTTCTGSVQVSADNFATCIAMNGAPATGDDTTFTLTPMVALDSATTYDIRVTTAAQDAALNAIATPFTTATGFTVRYARTIVIDGTNDFGAENLITSSTSNTSLYFSYDDTNLYVGVAAADILADGTGSGDKFIYFLFSTDTALATGNTRSSDDKAQFGAAGTSQLSHHWKVRIDGESYEEHRIGDGTDWMTDWTSNGKVGSRVAGYFEGSLALSELGNPATVVVTTFTVDYAGDGGNGWLYNMIVGATDGSAATPRDVFAYGQLALPTSNTPNTLSHLMQF